MPSEVGQEPAGSMIALISVVVIACEQALLFGRAKRASRERVLARTRSRETRFTRPNRRACSQAKLFKAGLR